MLSEQTKIARTNVAWYAVRCCCQPQKIFGFIQLETSQRRFKLLDERGSEHDVELRTMNDSTAVDFRADTVTVALEIAIYSDDRPIEFWRTIPGFVEVGAPTAPYPRLGPEGYPCLRSNPIRV